jgi:hypothetical protein
LGWGPDAAGERGRGGWLGHVGVGCWCDA